MSDQPEEMPENPFSSFIEAAFALHEAFSSYLAAGFTEPQALYLTACAQSGGPREQR